METRSANIAALSAVLRIKAGLCPNERLEDVTVDFREHAPYLQHFLSSETRFGIVLGPYGSGKTHFLRVAKQTALSQGFAVAHLDLDTGLGSLSHPQRHVLNLIRSMSLPAPYGSLLEWLGTSLDDFASIPRIERWFSELRSDCRLVVDSALWILRQADKTFRAGLLLEYLSGALLVGKTSHSSSRLRAYELLGFWTAFCTRILGFKGLVLLIDEFENLFSNALYWNILSRRSAYRTLSFYTESLRATKTLCALTPEGLTLFHAEIRTCPGEFFADVQQVAGERVRGFLSLVDKTTAHSLTAFGNEHYRMLYDSLVGLHAEARGYAPGTIRGFPIDRIAGPGSTPRIFAKSVVSALEGDWFVQSRGSSRGS